MSNVSLNSSEQSGSATIASMGYPTPDSPARSGWFGRNRKQPPADYRSVVQQARQHFGNHEFDQAIATMEVAVDLSGNDARLIVELGEYNLAAGRWLQAKRNAQMAIERNDRLASAWYLRGQTQAAKSEYTNAMRDYQRALGLDPTRRDIQLRVAQTWQHLGQPLRALSAAEQILDASPPQNPPEDALLTKTVALMALQQIEPAIELLETASRQPTATSEVFLRLGQAQLMAGQTSQARMTLARAKQKHPGDGRFDQLALQLQDSGERVASIE